MCFTYTPSSSPSVDLRSVAIGRSSCWVSMLLTIHQQHCGLNLQIHNSTATQTVSLTLVPSWKGSYSAILRTRQHGPSILTPGSRVRIIVHFPGSKAVDLEALCTSLVKTTGVSRCPHSDPKCRRSVRVRGTGCTFGSSRMRHWRDLTLDLWTSVYRASTSRTSQGNLRHSSGRAT